ncbi:thiopeptide-type bacteriocin biosynthesis protein [Actinomadura pelletieri DSM 43383]|uniref:Thiopeptide-type bacteriocin biosynthesis protein n=1 Tax=Actinomadura pelletieri DSM 43383 TaxID=1120940 RepID=A0A495Q9E0_9ACTN|nr:lantibiotic dehydratase [Actinomadura pelletieri]RKS68110.1 thiopeptide-type bacteriocin biosynthesis protein [Actinomadura pelletieri DSM 43383]
MRSSPYKASRTVVLRAVPIPARPGRRWPDLTDGSAAAVDEWLEWLADVWRDEQTVEAIGYATAELADGVTALLSAPAPAARRVRSVVMTVARYLLRARERPTPFGFFAGVAPACFGAATAVEWGDDHVAVTRASAPWLAGLLAHLEGVPDLLAQLPVAANSTAILRGDRLIVPYQASEQSIGTVDVAMRHTAAVRTVMAQARTPIRFADLAASLQQEFPGVAAEAVTGMLTELVHRRALISSLHAPATVPDALGHLVGQLHRVGGDQIAGVADLVRGLTLIHDRLQEQNRVAASKGRAVRRDLADEMSSLIPRSIPTSTGRGPLAVDLRLDAKVVLPWRVAGEVERAAYLLARLSAYPSGTGEWGAYLKRFWERYGIGSLVPVADVVADLGYPAGYPGTGEPPRRPTVGHRDEVLLELAQAAALDGRDEVVVDETLLDELASPPDELRLPPHLELGVRLSADSAAAVDGGDFTVEVLTVSRGAGTLTGRFLPILNSSAAAATAVDIAGMPGADPDTMVVQISFSPLRPRDAHLARTGQIWPTLLSLAEHRPFGERVLTVDDMAVGCDGHRLYLAAPALGRRVEVVAAHALNVQVHTAPLARLLIEIGRAHATQVTPFDWGPADRLPFRPRVRCGRIILAPAQWRLTEAELSGRAASWPQWETALSGWRHRRRLPRRVLIAEGDQRLPLDLDEAAHRALLRAHLTRNRHARLLEAPASDAADWCAGRSHELVVTVAATTAHSWPPLPRPAIARVLHRGHGHLPGSSGQMFTKLYGPAQLQDLLLAERLPKLLHRLGDPQWWFLRFADSDGPHLRLRITLPEAADESAGPAMFGKYAGAVGEWAADLHQTGLARHITYATCYPEVGRWGSGRAYRLAERVFAADSHAVCTQLRTPSRPDPLVLAAVHTTAIAAAFTGGAAAGMRWLIDHLPARPPSPVARPVFREAVRLADPRDDWGALRGCTGGQEIMVGWRARQEAVAAYRAVLPDAEQPEGDCAGIIPDQVLRSLLHVHFIRGYGIDRQAEDLALHLTRSAALAWEAKEGIR